MYRVTTVEGIVLKRRHVAEANAVASIFTRELGLIRLSVRSARAESSKLRYGIEPLTHGYFSFVEGRHEWRLIGVRYASSGFYTPNRAVRMAAGRVAHLLMRLVEGPEPIEALYATVEEGLQVLRACDEQTAAYIEYILVLRILSRLGYVPSTSELMPFIQDDQFPHTLITSARATKPLLVRTINASLKASGL